MGEDQDAYFHDDHDQRSIFVEGEEHVADCANTNTNNKKKGGDEEGSRKRLCIKFKITPTRTTIEPAHEDDNNNNNDGNGPKVCPFCKKTFGSGKALGGHMRVHSVSIKKEVHQSKENPNNSSSKNTDSHLITCDLCKRCFPSKKSLFGHMRSHPERVWRGIEPPSTLSPTTTPTKDSNSAFGSTVLKGWSTTAKRGRRSLSSSCSKTCSEASEHDDDIELELEELQAAYQLMLLSNWNPKAGVVSSPVSPIKKLKIEQKQPQSYEEGLVSDSHNSNGSNVGMDMSMENKSISKKKGTKKRKLTDLGKANKNNNLDNGAATRCIECGTCNKSFSNHQVLGGHLSSHRESKSIPIVNGSGSYDVSATEKEKEITATMQVDHETDDAVGQGQKKCSKILSLDLNQLPAMDDEEDGVQSDLIVTAPSSYASSSQNSVTHQ